MADKYPMGWAVKNKRLRCEYEFKDFVQAMSFLTEVGFAAEKQEHHPDFTVHWNQVSFEVWSHDEDRITDRDQKLVANIAKIAKRHEAKTKS